jgi:hypothetical protein
MHKQINEFMNSATGTVPEHASHNPTARGTQAQQAATTNYATPYFHKNTKIRPQQTAKQHHISSAT